MKMKKSLKILGVVAGGAGLLIAVALVSNVKSTTAQTYPPAISISASSPTGVPGRHVELYIHGTNLGQYYCSGSGSKDFSGPQSCDSGPNGFDVGSPQVGTSITYTINAYPAGTAVSSLSASVTVTSQPDVSVPVVTVSNDSQSINLVLKPGSPSEDFRYTVCWAGQCATTPWASDAISSGNYDTGIIATGVNPESEPTGAWTNWFGPGGGLHNVSVSVAATGTMPAGELLYPRVGVQLSTQSPANVGYDTTTYVCGRDFFDGAGSIGGGTAGGTVIAPTDAAHCWRAGTPGAMRISISGSINPPDYDSPLAAPAPTPITPITPTANGTVNVTSENSVTGVLLPAAWQVWGSTIPGMIEPTHQGTSQSLTVPANDDNVGVNPIGAGGGYVLRDAEEYSDLAVKKNDNPLSELLVFSKDLLVDVANAENTCSYTGTPGQQCPPFGNLPASDFNVNPTLTNAGDIANFILLWDPLPAMNVYPTTIALDSSSALSTTTVITNYGSSGSNLGWTANVNYIGGAEYDWLSLSADSGSITNSASQSGIFNGASSTITLTVDPSGLPDGTYNTTVDINGTSPVCAEYYGYQDSRCSFTDPVNVSFTVKNIQTLCTPPTISITPASSTITVGDSQPLTITSTGADSCTNDFAGGQLCNGTTAFTSTGPATYTVVATAKNQCGSASASADVTVVPPPGCTGTDCGGASTTIPSSTGGCTGTDCGGIPSSTPSSTCIGPSCSGSTPSCALTATPSSITPGQSSKLSYSCSPDVTNCSLSPWVNNQLAGTYSYGGSSGSEPVRPTTNTTYELNCDSGAINESATVIVTNPGLNETNP